MPDTEEEEDPGVNHFIDRKVALARRNELDAFERQAGA